MARRRAGGAAADPAYKAGVHALRKHWFLLGLAAAIALAWAWPSPGASGGALRLRELTLPMIAAVFLLAGLSVRTSALRNGATAWRAHLFVQAFSLAVIPLAALALDPLLGAAGMPPPLRLGLLALATLPTTIASCVACTRAAGGDESIALTGSVVGNLLGIVATPALLLALTGLHGEVPALRVLEQLATCVALPLAVGQVARHLIGERVDRWRPAMGVATNLMLLAMVHRVFCDAVVRGAALPGVAIAAAAAVAGLLHVAALGGAWVTSGWEAWRMDRRQRVAAAITASQKTVALGVPLLSLMLPGHPELPLITLPLLIYHALQLLLAGALAPTWQRWAEAPTASR